jgi:hypothetical protein
MSDTTDWPLGEGVRVPAVRLQPVQAGRSLPRLTWALAAAAFVTGVLVSAAAFSIGWRHQAQHGSSTEAALATATARSHALAGSLTASRRALVQARAQLAAAQKAKTDAVAASRTLSRETSGLATTLVGTGRSADSVAAGTSSVGATVDRVAGELKTLTTYLTTTPTAQLDPGYVATQSSYLAKQLDELKSARTDLAAAIADFEAETRKLADSAATLSGSS